MILTAICALAVLGVAFAWGSKARGYGFFSALVTLACVLVAGAIAFGLWETVVYKGMFRLAQGDGFFARVAMDNAWGIGLLLPFVVSLLVLRLVTDRLVQGNLEMSDTANFIGGSLVGIVTGSITVGICVVGLGHMRTGTGLFGYQPFEDERGNMQYTSPLWVPVDMAVIRLYEGMSVGSFSTGTPLAEFRPDAHVMAGLSRMTFDGMTRPTLLPGDVDVLGTYTISGSLSSLLTDRFKPEAAQQPLTIDGENYRDGSVLRGYALRFNAGAKEKSGNVILTAAQVQLVVEKANGGLERILPIALIERTGSGDVSLARFRFDAAGTTATSVGGASEAVFGFEFLVPSDAEPRHLFVKNVRKEVDDLPVDRQTAFSSVTARDEAIIAGNVFEPFGVSSSGSGVIDVDRSGSETLASTEGRFELIRAGRSLPFNIRLQVSMARGQLTLNEENRIMSGTGRFDANAKAGVGLDRDLVVDSIFEPRGTTLVQIDVATEGRKSIFGRALDAAEQVAQPILMDSNGRTYLPIGYALQEGESFTISVDPSSPIRSLSQIPALSSTRQQSLKLLFAPDTGATITSFLLGNKEVASFGDGFEVQ